MKNSKEILIRPATLADLPALSALGHTIWWLHYPGIISGEQIAYMLARRYSVESLKFQIEQLGHRYHIAFAEGEEDPCGFVSFTNVTSGGESYLYVHRLYLLPTYHGRGLGRALMDVARQFAEAHGHVRIRLNVHRDNPAQFFYLGYGFTILNEVDIPYGPYWLNDYTMNLEV